MEYKLKFNPSTSYLQQNILKCGFPLKGDRKYDDYTYLSLRSALVAYFSTYRESKHSLHLFKNYPKIDEDADFNTHTGYIAEAFKCIVFFQHFFELAIKSILRAESPILAGDTSTKPDVLYKLIKGQTPSDDEINSIQSSMFGEALERAVALIKSGHLDKAKYGFIANAEASLTAINSLRNRVWHRGVYVLRYPALDELMGGHVLPLAMKFVSLPEFAGYEHFWKYRDLACGVDPLAEIVGDFSSGTYNIKKIALLKEMARAGYNAPLKPKGTKSWSTILETAEINRAEVAASAEEHSAKVEKCPVCGIEAMAKYEDSETIGDQYDQETGELIGYDEFIRYIFEVRCFFCEFDVDSMVGNPSEHGMNVVDLFSVD